MRGPLEPPLDYAIFAMNNAQRLKFLKAEWERITDAMRALYRLQLARGEVPRRRGRRPKWLTELKECAEHERT